MNGPRIVSLGEALVDLIGDPLSGYRALPGGSPLNAAVAAARLGVSTAMLTRFSRDAFGDHLRAHLQRAGVDLSLAQLGDDPTSLAVVTLDAAGGARYAFYREGSADVGFDPQPRPQLPASVSVGNVSLSLLLPPARDAYFDIVRESGRAGSARVQWLLDPNARPALWPDPSAFARELERWTPLIDVIKVSDEDLSALHVSEAEATARWLAAGVSAVAVTAGAQGARLHWRGGPPIAVAGRSVSVMDTVGAGDTFTAGLTTGLVAVGSARELGAAEWRALLTRAVAAATLTCTRAGADPPQAAELAALLAQG
jgi:fructokinase